MKPIAAPGGKEQRRHARVIPMTHEPVEVQVMGGAFLEVVTALDISVGGVCIDVAHGFSQPEMSEKVQLILTLPGKKSFKAQGTIRHLTVAGGSGCFGVEFTELDPVHRKMIETYVEQMLHHGRRS
jgi:c-di-GMP-binding flagellar brake protein YcgR